MSGVNEAFALRLTLLEYPRSSTYDPDRVIEHKMGPHPLWLIEALTNVMPIVADESVMDLGGGKAISSISLAREFGVDVAAVDLWIEASENRARIRQASPAGKITAVYADAMDLPFEYESFDVVVSVDAYHYFGTEPEALPRVLRVLRNDGRLAVVVPGFAREIDAWPKHLRPWWQEGFETFHSPEWWKAHWEQPGLVEVELADQIRHGHDQWLRWGESVDDWAIARGEAPYREEVEMLRADTEHLLGFTRLVARKR